MAAFTGVGVKSATASVVLCSDLQMPEYFAQQHSVILLLIA